MVLFPTEVDLDIQIDVGTKNPLKETPVWTDLNQGASHFVRGVDIARGKPSTARYFEPGSCTLKLDNQDGRFDPDNTQGAWSATFGRGNPVRIAATKSGGSQEELFRGYIDRIRLEYERPMAWAYVECVELTGAIFTKELNAEVLAAGQAEDRIGDLLTLGGWAVAKRTLAKGAAFELPATTYTGTVGAALQLVLEAEQGFGWCDGDGVYQFQSRVVHSGATSAATFDDSSTIGYEDFAVVYDADLLINEATITPLLGDPQTVVDATSVTANGPAGYSSANATIPTDFAAVNVADWIVGRGKDVQRRIEGFTLHPQKDGANLWPQALERQLNDMVTIKYQPAGSVDEIVQIVVIDAIKHTIRPGDWITVFTCHPLSTFETRLYWSVGVSDDLDTDTVLA